MRYPSLKPEWTWRLTEFGEGARYPKGASSHQYLPWEALRAH